ncbi:MAG: CRISPR-associated helicase Cas3' [Methanomassiliicoccaceae archaeon]|nr:CRISPR-associated helicase Cas3' [Methanomassiliicoccaceae archaeon]
MVKEEPMIEGGIAHMAEGSLQTVYDHLKGTAALSSDIGSKIGMAKTCEALGLTHDLGKLSSSFYKKILYGDRESTVDHSTFGAQFVKDTMTKNTDMDCLAEEAVSLVSMSHHSGLIDMITLDGKDEYGRRIDNRKRSNYDDIITRIEPNFRENLINILNSGILQSEFENIIKIFPQEDCFNFGLLLRYLLSCLVDADRLNTEEFCSKDDYNKRCGYKYVDWSELVNKLDEYISSKCPTSRLDDVRNHISKQCKVSAERGNGIYSLNLPTGSGKTLASLRFALNHALINKMERIVYVVPYTSIIDQNANDIKDIFRELRDLVLEHHSNMAVDDRDENRSSLRFTVDNWDSQIIFTTMVQFLNTFFSGGTSTVRRMHNLTRSVIIFDEIQALPIKCINLFNCAVNFITRVCGATAVVCTATQPPLDEVKKQLFLDRTPLVELSPEMEEVFKRVIVKNMHKKDGWNAEQIAELITEKRDEGKSVLFIANTKRGARNVFSLLGGDKFHLSTNMCPAHRKNVIDAVRKDLKDNKNTLCVSTQLIEAGVDMDFNVVIRAMAGLDSIAQSAGRCNRNGKMSEPGEVLIVNFIDERVQMLEDITKGRRAAESALQRNFSDPIGKEAMRWYYSSLFENRKHEMDYPFESTTLINILSTNKQAVREYGRIEGRAPTYMIRQSFKTANDKFSVIDSNKIGVITEYGEGRKISEELEKMISGHTSRKNPEVRNMLREAQKYSVEVFENQLSELVKRGIVCEVAEGSGVYRMINSVYDEATGLDVEQSEA